MDFYMEDEGSIVKYAGLGDIQVRELGGDEVIVSRKFEKGSQKTRR